MPPVLSIELMYVEHDDKRLWMQRVIFISNWIFFSRFVYDTKPGTCTGDLSCSRILRHIVSNNMDERRNSISTTVPEARCENCGLPFGFQRCPCGALFCDSVCQRKDWKMHKRVCAFVCFSDTQLGQTLSSDLQMKIFKFLWMPSNRTKWRRHRRTKMIQLGMLGEYN